MGTAELSRRLGVSKATVFRLIARGEIVPVYVTAHPQFEPEHVREFIAARRGRKEARNAKPRDQRGPATNRHPEDSSTFGAQEDPN